MNTERIEWYPWCIGGSGYPGTTRIVGNVICPCGGNIPVNVAAYGQAPYKIVDLQCDSCKRFVTFECDSPTGSPGAVSH